MAEHAEVFISGTTRDLASYRREIKDALLTLQIFPIEESLQAQRRWHSQCLPERLVAGAVPTRWIAASHRSMRSC